MNLHICFSRGLGSSPGLWTEWGEKAAPSFSFGNAEIPHRIPFALRASW